MTPQKYVDKGGETLMSDSKVVPFQRNLVTTELGLCDVITNKAMFTLGESKNNCAY